MKQILILFISIGIGATVLAQSNSFKDKTNHVISVGTTNSVIVNKYKYINDYAGFSNKQIALGFEIGYLFSYQVLKNLELKIGANIYSFVRDAFKYYSTTRISSAGLPNIPLLIEYQPFTQSDLFISGGVKLSTDPFDATFETYYPGGSNIDLYPEKSIKTEHKTGLNPIISLGIGGSKLIKNQYRIEWLLSYNQGTKSLREFTFIRYSPYVESKVYSYGSHLNFSLRYYFKKYNQND